MRVFVYNELISVYILMTHQPKKTTIKKDGEKIEFSLGDAGPTKYQIMSIIAKNNSIYGATVWLNTPLPDHDNKTPAELMLAGELEIVERLVEEFTNERKNK